MHWHKAHSWGNQSQDDDTPMFLTKENYEKATWPEVDRLRDLRNKHVGHDTTFFSGSQSDVPAKVIVPEWQMTSNGPSVSSQLSRVIEVGQRACEEELVNSKKVSGVVALWM